MKNRVMIIGIGNEFRGDDAAGLLVAWELRKRQLGAPIAEQTRGLAFLIDLWRDKDLVILIDAVEGSGHPGRIFRYNATNDPLPENTFSCSTHSLSLKTTIEIARSLGVLPQTLILYGIEGAKFTPGSDVSPSVAKAVESVCDQIELEIQTRTLVA